MASVKQQSVRVVLKIIRRVTSLRQVFFTIRERLQVALGGTENVSGHVSLYSIGTSK